MPLQVKEVKHYEVDYHTFDQFVKEDTGHDFSVVAAMEQGNDSVIELTPINSRFDMETKQSIPGELSEYDQASLDEFLEKGEQSSDIWGVPALLLGKWVREGKAPDGSYLIDVCW